MLYNSRKLIVDILQGVYFEEAYSNIYLNKILKKYEVETRDRGFITQVVYGTIKNTLYIDYVINKYSKVKVRKMKPLILTILRMSIYQLLYLDKVPHSAVCNEAVKIIKKTNFRNLSGFLNGVLRSIARGDKEIVLPNKTKEPVKYLSVKYSFPVWLVEKWLKELGDFDQIEKLLLRMNETPSISLRVNTLKVTVEEVMKALKDRGIQVEKVDFPDEALKVTGTSDVTKLPGFLEGHFTVQDRSSMLIPYAANVKPGDVVIDVCAAPGGKSTHIAAKMKDEGRVYARDIFDHKLDLIESNVKRLGISIIKTELKDACQLDKSLVRKADVVLVDAPCSGLGIISKKPDIKLSKSLEEIDQLQPIQKRILQNAVEYVKEDGVLIYSTCTLNVNENEKILDWLINKYDFRLDNMVNYLPDNLDCDTMEGGYVKLLPHVHETDGFFIARLIRKEK